MKCLALRFGPSNKKEKMRMRVTYFILTIVPSTGYLSGILILANRSRILPLL
jgi:predicted transcriptional regulator with HTH domain